MLPPLVAKKNSVCSESRCLQPSSLRSSLLQPGASRRPPRMSSKARTKRLLSPAKDPARTKPGCCTRPRRPRMHSYGREDGLGLERLRHGMETNLLVAKRGTELNGEWRGLHKPVTPEKQSPHKPNRKGPRGCPRGLRRGFAGAAQFCRARPCQARWTLLSHLPWERPVICRLKSYGLF